MKEKILTFKSNFPGLTVLQLHQDNFVQIQQSLREKIKQAPMMFIGMQVVLDISAFDQKEQLEFNFSEMKTFLQGEGLYLVAIMSDKQSHREKAILQGVGAFAVVAMATRNDAQSVVKSQQEKTARMTVKTNKQPVIKQKTPEEPRKNSESLSMAKMSTHNEIISHSIRSGQRVYAKGDLTIVGSVSPGAEVIADGNIHIYGALRGRAIAGAQGDVQARIFCQKLEAELVSIAGSYKPNEEIDDDFRHQRIQISLEGEKIQFLPL